jgi:hypothetical protein
VTARFRLLTSAATGSSAEEGFVHRAHGGVPSGVAQGKAGQCFQPDLPFDHSHLITRSLRELSAKR